MQWKDLDGIDKNYINVDPLADAYRDSFAENPEHRESLQKQRTALLVIDVQYLDAAKGYGVFADEMSSGVPPEAQEYYFKTLNDIVIPNIQLLQDAFRQNHLEVIHTRIQSLTKDGRDRSPGHKRLGLHAPPGSREADFIESVAPVGDEIVINKTASGVFSSTNIHYILNNLKIEALVVTGVYSNECVSSTVRAASDLGFYVTVVEDAVTTVTELLQQNTLNVLRDRYARIRTTRAIIEELSRTLKHS